MFLVAAGLFAYRLHHKPPLVALLQTTMRSQLVQSIISPIMRTLENNLERTIALASPRPESPADVVRPGDPVQSGDDLWQNGDDKGTNTEGEQDAVTAPPPPDQDQMEAPRDQSALPADDPGQQEGNSQQSAENTNGNENDNNSGNQQGAENKSMAQSLMQALKNMLQNPSGQQSNSRPNQRSNQPNTQGMAQSGNSNQPGTSPSNQDSDSRGRSEARQKASDTSSSGAGSQNGDKNLRPSLESHPVSAVPDRVALAASGFKDPTRVRNNTETGTAGLAVGNASPQAVAVINGAEQEDIPARYRMYVQRYFGHPDNNNNGQQ